MQSITKSDGNVQSFEGRFLIVLPGGRIALDLKNPGRAVELDPLLRDSNSLYYPLFPPERRLVSKEAYLRAHENLMAEMRRQLRLKNRRGIEKTGKKLYRLRKRYHTRFAA